MDGPAADSSQPPAPTRRDFLAACSAAGIANTLFPGALLSLAASSTGAQTGRRDARLHPARIEPERLPPITEQMIEAAAAIAGLSLTGAQKKLLIAPITQLRDSALAIRKLGIPNSVAPAFVFNPLPAGMALPTGSTNRASNLGAPPDISA